MKKLGRKTEFFNAKLKIQNAKFRNATRWVLLSEKGAKLYNRLCLLILNLIFCILN